jgi:hypothetical protein
MTRSLRCRYVSSAGHQRYQNVLRTKHLSQIVFNQSCAVPEVALRVYAARTPLSVHNLSYACYLWINLSTLIFVFMTGGDVYT